MLNRAILPILLLDRVTIRTPRFTEQNREGTQVPRRWYYTAVRLNVEYRGSASAPGARRTGIFEAVLFPSKTAFERTVTGRCALWSPARDFYSSTFTVSEDGIAGERYTRSVAFWKSAARASLIFMNF